ncbi:helix-turn-helix domain-containing protein [Streptomyces sp. NPDC097981]|uniref:nSTAND1 domain-containing NTPase n=1 Tax=Streptomyces sp. NPDC097981 TaxID=3155428 RepID=UPI003317C564
MAGRREVPVDPGAGPVQRFAFELRKLRTEAGGVTYRALAQRAGYSVTTLSQAAAGEQLPTLPVVLAYVQACGGSPAQWEARWRQAVDEAAALAAADDGADDDPPYRGLARFEAKDSSRFFGRDALTADLLDLLHRRRFAAVFGPSGSGKSSLLRAGLLPALQELRGSGLRPAAIRILTPGELPARTRGHLLAPTDSAGAGEDTLVMVDQFEEAFTLCRDPAERSRFIDMLLSARQPESRLRVLLAVRADFYGRCAEHTELAEALRDANLLAGPMNPAELRDAIVKPATAAGLTVERALTSRLVQEMSTAPGGLPLLSHVLMETWRRRRGHTLTLAGYEAAGGLEGSIAKTAEAAYSSFTERQAAAARPALLRLVAPGEGTADTRRGVRRTELEAAGREETAHVLEVLTRARILTLDDGSVELAHEALLTGWPRLLGWIEDDRERLCAQRELTEAARAWEELGRDPGALYRGSRLDTAREHFGPEESGDLTGLERTFLTTSLALRDGEVRGAARTVRRLRRLRAGVCAVVVLAVLAGVIAWQQGESRQQERLRAEARRVAALAASLHVSDPVTAMQLSVASWALADLPETRSALMSAAMQREQDAFVDPDAEPSAVRYLSKDGRSLLSVGERRTVQWDVRSHRQSASFAGLGDRLAHVGVAGPDARTLTLVGDDDRVGIWDVQTGRLEEGHEPPVSDGAELSPSGRTLVLYRTDGPQVMIQLRDVQTGRVRLERQAGGQLPRPGTGETFDIPAWTTRRLRQQHRTRGYPLSDVQVSPDDGTMALCLPGAPLQLWDVAQGRLLQTPWAPSATAGNCVAEDFGFTPDSRYLVLRDAAGVRRWEIASGKELPVIEHKGLRDLQFSSDGRFMAATDADEVLLWRTDAPEVPVFRNPSSDEVVSELRLDMDERRIRYFAGRSQTVVRSLSLEGVLDSRWQSQAAVAASFSPDGLALAVAHQDADSGQARIRLHDGRSGDRLADLPASPCPASDQRPSSVPCPVHMVFRPDGRVFAYGVSDPATSVPPETLSLWDVPAHRVIGSLDVTLTGATTPGTPPFPGNAVNAVVFHPDGTSLIASRIPDDERIEFWDVHRRTMTREVRGIGGRALAVKPGGRILATDHGQFLDLQSGQVTRRNLTPDQTTALTFSPDGKLLATGDESGRVTLWDGDTHQSLGGLPPTPVGDGHSRFVSALSFSPDGRTLAAAARDGTLRLWDTRSGNSIGSSFPTAGGAALSLAFSSDGSHLYAAQEHVPLQSYTVASDEVAAQVCERVREPLSPDKWRALIHKIPYRQVC